MPTSKATYNDNQSERLGEDPVHQAHLRRLTPAIGQSALSTSDQDVADTNLTRPARPEENQGFPASNERTTTPPSIWRRVRHDVILFGAGTVGVVICQLVFRSILIVALVPAEYGRLSLILSLYNTLVIVGASGLPNSTARYIALGTPGDDPAIVRSAVRAAAWPTVVAATVMAIVSGVLLGSPLAGIFGAIGLTGIAYTFLSQGILRGRGRVKSSAFILPLAAFSEAALLTMLWITGVGFTALSAFGVFCLGNVISLSVGIFCVIRTFPSQTALVKHTGDKIRRVVPSSRQLLGFSVWLALATAGIAFMPLMVRIAATLNSYTTVAIIDVALVLLSIPQRLGAVIVSAVVPHATREVRADKTFQTISRREHLFIIAPFAVAAIVVAFTPIIGWLFEGLGRPEYAKSAVYIALALLAGPARVLYGLVEGVLTAHGHGRFLAFNSLSITVISSCAIFAAAALGSTVVGFIIFTIACWTIYLSGLARIKRLEQS
jgi:O-antigen/teichoic acid export membrane protein